MPLLSDLPPVDYSNISVYAVFDMMRDVRWATHEWDIWAVDSLKHSVENLA